MYKEEETIPVRIRRDLNNVSSLLEIAQGIFDNVREKREAYVAEIEQQERGDDFLSQPVDFDTVRGYTVKRFSLPISDRWHVRLLHDLDLSRYRILADLDRAVRAADAAVNAYKNDAPERFQNGTAFITKSLGFVDLEFRRKHPFGKKTTAAFEKYKHLLP